VFTSLTITANKELIALNSTEYAALRFHITYIWFDLFFVFVLVCTMLGRELLYLYT